MPDPYLFTSFFIAFLLTPLIRWVACRRGWMAFPVKERWHEVPTALFGGIAIYLGLAIPLCFSLDFASVWQYIQQTETNTGPPSLATVFWIAVTLMFVLGLLDDFIQIKPHSKLIGQILVAALVAFLGFRLQWFTSLTLDTMVTMVWIIGITNAFNLIDNMDGLCAGTGFVAAVTLAILYQGQPGALSTVAILLAGALAAFLIFNFNPASIFMGDCGSLPIGMGLAVLSLSYAQIGNGNHLARYAVPVLVVMVPIVDTTLVTMIRLLSRRKASTGGRDHTSHRLVLMGFSEKGAVLFLYGAGIVSGIAAVFVHFSDTVTSPVVIIPIVLAIGLMAVYLAQLRIYPEKEFAVLREQQFTPVLLELTYKRQILLVILDLGLIAFSYYLSYRLRFESHAFIHFFPVFLRSLPAVIAAKLIAFFAVGVYRGIWGFMSSNDVFVSLKASSIATLLSVLAITFIYRFESFSKGIFVIDWLLTTAFVLGTRGSFRFFQDTMRRKTMHGERILIYGAGRGGEILLREVLHNQALKVQLVGFIDDDPLKGGKKLMGYPILGNYDFLVDYLQKNPIQGLLISFVEKDEAHFQRVKKLCKAHNVALKQFSICLNCVDLEQ